MIRTIAPAVALLAIAATPALAVRTTWSINHEWEFYTANTPAGTNLTNLVGTITWDTAVSNYYPAEWSFTLTHFDPIFNGSYPLTIEGEFPNLSDASGLAWTFRRDAFTVLNLRFSSAPGTLDILLNGTEDTIAFGANEYVQVGPNSSQRIINNGVMTLVPTPGAGALLGLASIAAIRRKR